MKTEPVSTRWRRIRLLPELSEKNKLYSIAECDNASRVIKYVMLLGYKYSHYNLVDMRIHDINVVADLNRHNPTGSDPTARYGEQYTASESEVGKFENLMDTAASSVTADWLEQWWPTILVSVLQQWTPAIELLIQLTIDLLGQVNVIQTVYQLGVSYEDVRQQNPNLDLIIEDILKQAQSETFAVTTAWTIASIAQVLAVNPVTFAIFMVAYFAWLLLFWNWFMKLSVLLTNRVTNIVAANMVFEMTVKMALVGVSAAICTKVLSPAIEGWLISNLGGKVAWLGTIAKWQPQGWYGVVILIVDLSRTHEFR